MVDEIRLRATASPARDGKWDLNAIFNKEIYPAIRKLFDRLIVLTPQTALGNDTDENSFGAPVTESQMLDWLSSGSAWIFDGVNDRVQSGNVLDKERTDSFTIGIWVTNAQSVNATILAKANSASPFNGYTVYFSAADTMNFRFCNQAVVNSLEVSFPFPRNGIEHYLAITYDGTSGPSGVHAYVDDVEQALTTVSNTLTLTTANAFDLNFGELGSTIDPFAGRLRWASMWDRVLSASEVSDAYNGGDPPDLSTLSTASDLQLWYKLDEGDTTGANGVVDHSSSGFNGTAQGGLGPSDSTGLIPVRGVDSWQTLFTGGAQNVLFSNGPGAIPSYGPLNISASQVGAETSMLGVSFILRKEFTALGAGVADDVTIYSSNVPFTFRIVDVWVLISTAIGGTTVQLRDTAGGGGSALSTALSSAATGTSRNNDTATRSLTAGSSLFLRRSNRGVAGEVLIHAVRG